MEISEIRGVSPAGTPEISESGTQQVQKKIILHHQNSGTASKQITKDDIENFKNEPNQEKAINNILQKSPIGLGKEPTKEELKKSGYAFTQTAYHLGAPNIFESTDGGKITVYDGRGTAEMGEDKKKIVYEKDGLIQEMVYDENGKLELGSIKVKDGIANSTERSINFVLQHNGKLLCFEVDPDIHW